MVDPVTIASLVLGGARFAWSVGRAIGGSRRRDSRHVRPSSPHGTCDLLPRSRQQITRSYTRPQLYAPPSLPVHTVARGPRITVFPEQRAYDTYEDEGTGIQMGTGFDRRKLMAPAEHWVNPFEGHRLGTVVAVDWTSRTAWTFVKLRGTYHLWYKVEDIVIDDFLQPWIQKYATATVTLNDGCPVWGNVPLEMADAFPSPDGFPLVSTNAWTRLGLSSDLAEGDLVFVGMQRALLMGILVGRYAHPTILNVDTLEDEDLGTTFIHIDAGKDRPRCRRGPAHITVFRANTRGWADEFVWVG